LTFSVGDTTLRFTISIELVTLINIMFSVIMMCRRIERQPKAPESWFCRLSF